MGIEEQKLFAAANVLATNIFENYDLKVPYPLCNLIILLSFASHLYAIRMQIVCTRMSQLCHLYVTRIYSYAIGMSLICAHMLSICTCMSFLCHSYAICMSLI